MIAGSGASRNGQASGTSGGADEAVAVAVGKAVSVGVPVALLVGVPVIVTGKVLEGAGVSVSLDVLDALGNAVVMLSREPARRVNGDAAILAGIAAIGATRCA